MSKIGDNLQRMRELAVQAANGSNGDDDRISLNTEFTQLQDEVKRITANTKFNGLSVTDGAAKAFPIGSGTTNDDVINISGANLTLATSATQIVADNETTISAAKVDILTQATAQDAMNKIDAALKEVNTESIKHGANQNRFAAVISTLQVSIENQTAARSRIMDTDFASETATMARGQILQQAGMAMLAQANQLPNGVMGLLR
jgi:flagellin